MKKRLLLWLIALFLLTAGTASAQFDITEPGQLNAPGITVGVGQGSAAEDTVRKLLPQANVRYFTDTFMGYTAVAQGKIDAYVYDRVQMQLAIENGQPGVHLLNETLGEAVRIAVGISPVSRIPDLENQVNRFIAEIRADGTLDDLYRRWVLDGIDEMPEIPVQESASLHLTVGTTGNVPPYSYYKGSSLAGYDIELAYRFAAWLGADVSFQVYDFDGVIPAAVSGKIDVIMSNLQYLPERAEELTYSDILFEERQGIMVRGEAQAEQSSTAPLSPLSWDGRRMGIVTGSIFEAATLEKYPNSEYLYYNTNSDVVTALTNNKIDGFLGDEPVIRVMCQEVPEMAYLPEMLTHDDYAFGFGKTGERANRIRGQFNEMLSEIQRDGTMDAMLDKWFGSDEAAKVVDLTTGFSGENGNLNVVTCSADMPFSYIKDGKPAGLVMDMVELFCRRYGYTPVIEDVDFAACIPGLVSGKSDMCASSMAITEERKESINFSDPYYKGGIVLAVRAADLAAETDHDALPAGVQTDTTTDTEESFLDGLKASFGKTFLRENRWQLFLEGIGTTMLITLLSILFGTALGFVLFMLCRNGNPLANGVTRFSIWLVTGTPMVVLLMILYYIIFGSVAISGIAVAVIGFTLTFGAAVFSLLKMGVGTVDRGQSEAACALGYSNRHTFFRIILPQAIPHVLPAYRGEIVGLIKATAIVGYIAVQDLTKMGDIVRSRTYEAFFPLIAVTVIYFVLEGLFSFAVSRIRISIDPKMRSRERILKGIDLQG